MPPDDDLRNLDRGSRVVVVMQEKRSCDTVDLESAFQELLEAAEPISRRTGSTPHEDDSLRAAAVRYVIAELETQFPIERIPPGHVGDEPSLFDALDHLKTLVTP